MLIPNRFPLDEAARRFPRCWAYVDQEKRISYAQLRERVEARRNQLRAHGLRPGQRVALLPAFDAETLRDMWALLAARAVVCPISPRFPSATQEERAQQLRAVWLTDLAELSHRSPGDQVSPSESSAATIFLSSGSTGNPKAVVHSLRAHVANAMGAAPNMPLIPGDRWLWSLPAFHVSGFSILIRCATAGATIVGAGAEASPSNAFLETFRLTHLSLVPTQLRRLLESDSFPPSSLKAVLLGGSAAPWSLIQLARRRGVPLHTTYGLTETASQVATTSADDPDDALRTAGYVLPGRELKISDDGEILVRGETLCIGYDQNGRVLPVVDENGWFATGDLGRLDAQRRLIVTGRRDNMFISAGENLHPENIERALLELPGIQQAVVAPRDDPEYGARPVAFIDAADWNEASWKTALARTLTGLEMPVAFLRWPDDNQGLKPSRVRLRELRAAP